MSSRSSASKRKSQQPYEDERIYDPTKELTTVAQQEQAPPHFRDGSIRLSNEVVDYDTDVEDLTLSQDIPTPTHSTHTEQDINVILATDETYNTSVASMWIKTRIVLCPYKTTNKDKVFGLYLEEVMPKFHISLAVLSKMISNYVLELLKSAQTSTTDKTLASNATAALADARSTASVRPLKKKAKPMKTAMNISPIEPTPSASPLPTPPNTTTTTTTKKTPETTQTTEAFLSFCKRESYSHIVIALRPSPEFWELSAPTLRKYLRIAPELIDDSSLTKFQSTYRSQKKLLQQKKHEVTPPKMMAFPQVFVFHQDYIVTVVVGCPGASETDFSLSVKRDVLQIIVTPSFSKQIVSGVIANNFVMGSVNEIATGTYTRLVILPFEVDTDPQKTTCEYSLGVAMFTFTKAKENDYIVIKK